MLFSNAIKEQLMNKNEIMKLAIERACKTMNENIGGPFGAVITKGNKIIAVSSNTVLADKDPTAHAEVNAIREACKALGTIDLSGCELYATGYPCPMCLSAIIWSNISKVYFGCTPEDAEDIGFRDEAIYRYIESLRGHRSKDDSLTLLPLDREDCIRLFEEYQRKDKIIY